MPTVDIGVEQKPFFRPPISPAPNFDPDELSQAFGRVWSGFISGTRADGSYGPLSSETALTNFVGWAFSGLEPKTLPPEKRLVHDFFSSFKPYLTDYSEQQKLRVPARLDRDAEATAEILETLTHKAVRNQEAAQGLYLILKFDPPDSPRRKNAETTVALCEAMAQKNILFGKDARMFFAGARAQAGLMRLLDKNNFQVLAVDPQNSDEVKNCDVLGHTDLMAYSPTANKIYLLDVKAKLAYEYAEEESDRFGEPKRAERMVETVGPTVPRPDSKYTQRHEQIRAEITKFLHLSPDTPYAHATIWIPSSLPNLSLIGEIDENIGRGILAELKRL